VPESLTLEGEPLAFKVYVGKDETFSSVSIDIYDHGLHLHPRRHCGYWIYDAGFAPGEALDLEITLDVREGGCGKPVRVVCGGRELEPSSSWHNPEFIVSPILDVMVVAARDGEEVERVNIPTYVQDPALLKRYYSAEEHQGVYGETAFDIFLEQFHAARVRVLASTYRRYFRDIKKVVDVGSGTSMFRHISEEWPYEITCCDLDEPALRTIREESPHFKCVESDAVDLPFPGGEFDGLYAGEIIEHVIDPREAVKEWVRVVRPGGVIIVTTPNAARLLNRVNREREVVNPEHINELSYREIWKLLEEEGLRILECRGIYLEFLFNYFRRGKKIDLLPRRFGHPRYRFLYRLAMGMGNLARPFAFDLVFVTRKGGSGHAATPGS
jgi:SAM-dependent methyltransferase